MVNDGRPENACIPRRDVLSAVKEYELNEKDPRFALRKGVMDALRAVPSSFSSKIYIEGLDSTDLFSMNSLLGGAIENQTTEALNSMRSVWDKEGLYKDCVFRRHAESYPDVRLEKGDGAEPLIGIELKGWFLMSKEKEPSFRFRASSGATSEWDIMAVFPWALTNVVSGSPYLMPPFLKQAKYIADLRTAYWINCGSNGKRTVRHPENCHPYPLPGESYSDSVSDDRGGNFGRIARIDGLMDEWVDDMLNMELLGIEARWWIDFLKLFTERSSREDIAKALVSMERRKKGFPSVWRKRIQSTIESLEMLLEET